MYARVTAFRVEPAQLDAFADRVRETLAPAVAQQRGHRGGLLLTDRATGKVLAVNPWETDADLQAAEPAGAYREVLGMLLGVVPGSEVHETYEVSVQS
jgi:hypothetical protein